MNRRGFRSFGGSLCSWALTKRWALRLAALEGIPLGKSKDRFFADLLAQTVTVLLEAPDDVRRQVWQRACGRLRGERAAVALHLAAMAASIQRQATLGAVARSLIDVRSWRP